MTVIVIDDIGAQQKLKKLREVMDEPTLLKVIGADVLAWVMNNFRHRGIERQWKPLAQSTIRGRRKGSSAPLQDTGKLKQSFSYELEGSQVVRIGTVNRVAPFHQFGTRPYTIRPVRARVLRFMGADGPVFARGVNHPGLEARPMLPSKRLAENLAITTIQTLLRKKLPSD